MAEGEHEGTRFTIEYSKTGRATCKEPVSSWAQRARPLARFGAALSCSLTLIPQLYMQTCKQKIDKDVIRM